MEYQIRQGQINGVGLHYTDRTRKIRLHAPANADSPAHFSNICEGWVNASFRFSDGPSRRLRKTHKPTRMDSIRVDGGRLRVFGDHLRWGSRMDDGIDETEPSIRQVFPDFNKSVPQKVRYNGHFLSPYSFVRVSGRRHARVGKRRRSPLASPCSYRQEQKGRASLTRGAGLLLGLDEDRPATVRRRLGSADAFT